MLYQRNWREAPIGRLSVHICFVDFCPKLVAVLVKCGEVWSCSQRYRPKQPSVGLNEVFCAAERNKDALPRAVIIDDAAVRCAIRDLLKKAFEPEQVAGHSWEVADQNHQLAPHSLGGINGRIVWRKRGLLRQPILVEHQRAKAVDYCAVIGG